ncbi:MAG TPA: FdtA/QdtA family cupin domain-containing protein [Methanolinea sp.]|nr:FdtA/QdtA family cupin domain-containing protein [Methanolinea sp.]HQK56759.1 FdtA/QdtA family cupin domain-containing protein [Methanolinea sp.]
MHAKWKILDFPWVSNNGTLTYIEEKSYIPFLVKRIFWLTNIPENSIRGNHAHKNVYEIIVAISGSFSVRVNDGQRVELFQLSSPSSGILIAPYVWIELFNFTSDSICLVIASGEYNEKDYIRNYDEFIQSQNSISQGIRTDKNGG